MKTNKYFPISLGFLTGSVFGISLFAILSFTNAPGNPAPGPGVNAITAEAAHAYFNNYMTDAVPFDQVLKGFTIDKAQLEAMNNISKENPDLTGFRLYMGRDKDARNIGIVVGVDNTGRDAVRNTIYGTDSKQLSPCPPICDVASPITNN